MGKLKKCKVVKLKAGLFFLPPEKLAFGRYEVFTWHQQYFIAHTLSTGQSRGKVTANQSWTLRNVDESCTLCRSCNRLLFSCSGLQYAQQVCYRHSPTYKLPSGLWRWWPRERCFPGWLLTPPTRPPPRPPRPPAQHQSLVLVLPAGDRWFGPDRVARGNPPSHIHRPPRSLMQCVVPEKKRDRATERKREREKGGEKGRWREKIERSEK